MLKKTLYLGLWVGLLGAPTGAAWAQASTTPKPVAKSATKPTKAAARPAGAVRKASKAAKPAPVLPPVGGIAPEVRARQMTASMTRALGLIPAQATRVQEINLQSIQNVEGARRTYARQLPQMHAQIDLIGRSRLSLLKNVLSDQQFRDYITMREQKMGVPDADKQGAKMSEAAGGQ